MNEENNNYEKQEDENNLIAQRREKLSSIRMKREAFPNAFKKESKAVELVSAYSGKEKIELEELTVQAKVAGRIIRMRGPFVVISDEGTQIQLYMNRKLYSEAMAEELKSLDLGDIIGVKGQVFKTNQDELTVRVEEFELLTKSLRPLPDKYKGLTDMRCVIVGAMLTL